eukprot:4394850-Alexandrium_andersonii.AAC.1
MARAEFPPSTHRYAYDLLGDREDRANFGATWLTRVGIQPTGLRVRPPRDPGKHERMFFSPGASSR